MTVERGERTGASALAPVADAAWLHDGSSLVGHDEVLVLELDERDQPASSWTCSPEAASGRSS